MARPRSISPDELSVLTKFRIQIVKWNDYQEFGEGKRFKGKQEWLKLAAARTTDTINEERLDVRGLFFDMLRHSAAGRRAGYLVDGNNEPLTLQRLCRIMFVKLEDLIPPFKRLMETDRIKVLVDSQSSSTEEDQDQVEHEKIRKYQVSRIFWMAWHELHSKSYGREYDKSQWDDMNLLKTLTPENLERMIAYSFYFHQFDKSVGIPRESEKESSTLKPPSLDNFLKKVSEYSSRLRGEGWTKSQKWSTKFLMKNQSQSQ